MLENLPAECQRLLVDSNRRFDFAGEYAEFIRLHRKTLSFRAGI